MEVPNPATPSATDDTHDDGQNIEVELTPQEYKTLLAERDAQIKKLKKEAMEKRHERNEAQKRADEAEQKRRLLAGEYEPVVEDLTAKVKTLEPYRERYEAIQAQIQAANEKRLAQLPDLYRDLVPSGSPEEIQQWLDRALPKLTIQPAPELDPGRRGAGQPAYQLSQAQREMATRLNIPLEQYAKQAQQAEEERNKRR